MLLLLLPSLSVSAISFWEAAWSSALLSPRAVESIVTPLACGLGIFTTGEILEQPSGKKLCFQTMFCKHRPAPHRWLGICPQIPGQIGCWVREEGRLRGCRFWLYNEPLPLSSLSFWKGCSSKALGSASAEAHHFQDWEHISVHGLFE